MARNLHHTNTNQANNLTEADMAREGGSYIKEKGGKLKLVHRTQPAGAKETTKAAKKKGEVNTNEDQQ